MKYNIALIRGDGIGREIVESAVEVLNHIGGLYNHEFCYTEVTAGGVSIDKYGSPLLDEELSKC